MTGGNLVLLEARQVLDGSLRPNIYPALIGQRLPIGNKVCIVLKVESQGPPSLWDGVLRMYSTYVPFLGIYRGHRNRRRHRSN